MAVPQLAPTTGAVTVGQMMQVSGPAQDPVLQPLKNLVNFASIQVSLLTQLVDIQSNTLDALRTIFDEQKEATSVQTVSGSVGATEDDFEFDIKSFGKIILATLGALTLWSNDLAKYIRAVLLPSQLLNPVIRAFGAVFSSVALAKAFAPVNDFFGRINKALAPKNFTSLTKAIDFFMTPLRNVIKGFTAVGKEVQVFGKTVTVAFKDLSVAGKIGASIRAIVDPFVRFFKFIGDISGITQSVGKAAGMFAKIMPVLKGIASKLLLPLFAIFDFVSGFIEGFSKKGEDDARSTMEKTLDGLLAGAIKLIKGIFIVPLDLLKDGVSWLAEKIGFENFSKALDSFSFNDTFDKFIKFGKNIFSSEPEEGYFSIVKWAGDGIDNIVKYMKSLIPNDIVGSLKTLAGKALDIITSPGRWIWNNAIKPAIDAVTKMFNGNVELPDTGDIGDMATNFLKNILRSVLPDPNAGFIQNLASKAIPNSVYEFAGLDPKTGQELPKAMADTPTGRGDGAAELAARTQAAQSAREQKQTGATVLSAPSDNRDMSQTNISKSTYIAPSPVSYPADPNWDYSYG